LSINPGELQLQFDHLSFRFVELGAKTVVDLADRVDQPVEMTLKVWFSYVG